MAEESMPPFVRTFVDNTLEPDYGEESTGDSGGGNGQQDGDSEHRPRRFGGLALEEDIHI